MSKPVVNWQTHAKALEALLTAYGLKITAVPNGSAIPGSYWGENEAGLVANQLFLRDDTPLHSALHEACHYICMDNSRRQRLHTDAGGSDIEENGVCYLQILLSDCIAHYGRQQMFSDMDNWGYSFRLGSAQRWFENDAEDAQNFLRNEKMISPKNLVCIGQLRQ